MSYLFKPSKGDFLINIKFIESVQLTQNNLRKIKMASGEVFYLEPDDFERLDNDIIEHGSVRKIKLSGAIYHLLERIMNRLP